MNAISIETGRVTSVVTDEASKSQIIITLVASDGQEKQVKVYQGSQPLALVEGEDLSCILHDSGTELQGLAYVNLSRRIHQETPPRYIYNNGKRFVLLFIYIIALGIIASDFFNPWHGNTLQVMLFTLMFTLGCLAISPFLIRWGKLALNDYTLMTEARQFLQQVLVTKRWERDSFESSNMQDTEKISFSKNKKGQYFVRIWRPAPGTVVETPHICPFCDDDAEVQDIGSQYLHESISIAKGPFSDPPGMKIYVCAHHRAILGPMALGNENNKMLLSICAIELGVPLLVSMINFLGPSFFILFIIMYVVSVAIANILFIVFGYKRIMKGSHEKEDNLHFGAWRSNQVTLFAKNSRWLAMFTRMHPELIAPTREIPMRP